MFRDPDRLSNTLRQNEYTSGATLARSGELGVCQHQSVRNAKGTHILGRDVQQTF
jgi:hypothetical protein